MGSQLLPSFWTEIFIHSFIQSVSPPTMSTYYGADNVLHAGNTVFNNSVIQHTHGI